MKRFYRFLFFIQFITTTLLLLILCNYSEPKISHKEVHQNHIHKILYVDPNFSDEEFVYISMAAAEWTRETNGIAKFDVVKLPQKSIDKSNSILIVKVSEYYPNIVLVDRITNHKTIGFFDKNHPYPNIEIVESRITAKIYKSTVLHELGHVVGLLHNEGIDGMGTLMYPYDEYGGNSITETDLKNFCKIYHCDASKLHHQ